MPQLSTMEEAQIKYIKTDVYWQSLSNIAASAAKCSTHLAVLVRQVEYRLRQIGRLHDAADFDRAFLFNEFAH